MVEPITPAIQWICDKLVGLVKGRSIEKADLFKNHVDPLYKEVEKLYKDYQKSFVELRKHLMDNTVPSNEIVEFLKERRLQYDANRDLTQRLSEALIKEDRSGLSKKNYELIKAYCESILKFFSVTGSIGGTSWYSFFVEGVERRIQMGFTEVWETSAITENPRRALLTQVNGVLENQLKQAFSSINRDYSKLKVNLL